jgi:hypothetical protein
MYGRVQGQSDQTNKRAAADDDSAHAGAFAANRAAGR